MRHRPLLLVAISTIALGSLGGAAVAQADAAAELERNERLWETTRPQSYTYAIERLCFCLGRGQPVRITVEGEEVIERVDVASGDRLDPALADDFPAVEGLFDLIRDAIETDAHELVVTYDSVSGVPIDIWVDYDERIADEELGYRVTEPVMPKGDLGAVLPTREGAPPSVTEGIPHVQLDQTSDDAHYDALVDLAFADERVTQQPSRASLPGALGLTLASDLAANVDAMIVGREFAHIHAEPGRGSMHLRLPEDIAIEVINEGWGVWHPFALDGSLPGLVMVFAPRTDADLNAMQSIIEAAIDFAAPGTGE